jgi:hypothetical protein
MHDLVIGLFINRYELEYQFESQTPDLEQRPCFIADFSRYPRDRKFKLGYCPLEASFLHW